MDYGTVTGSNGKKADCRNIVLILTSNLGAEEMEKGTLGFGEKERTEDDDAVKKFFAPEFRNRLDAVVKFSKLAKETMKKIVGKFMLDLNTMTAEKRVEVNATETAIEYLIEKGFDDKMGARPLQRIIDDEIKKPLSRMILFGDLQEGGRVEVSVKDDKLDIIYKKAIVTEQFKPKTQNAETS
jgi:ATP-dependent Clp protease ATP-binding subunit ClpA